MTVSLGPFVLDERLASGGMGEVWRARHVHTGASVAVKFLTGARAMLPEFASEFRREVQATARLDHPNIVRVFDYGELSQDVPGGKLAVGTPYYVMELGEHGDLGDLLDAVDFAHMQALLASLLEALAHAHARGVIHRDIKPANILIRDTARTEVLLTDFGIAHASDKSTRTDAVELTARSTETATGTPRYMAPEQFMGEWRDYGPWTDIYAVGVIAYQIVAGHPPFSEATFLMYAMAHMNKAFPPISPRFALPTGFEPWLARMTAKRPGERFQHASDARLALLELEAPHAPAHVVVMGAPSDDEEDATVVDEVASGPWSPPTAPLAAVVGVPENLRRKASSFRPMPGAGLGLLGLRPAPFTGREAECESLWTHLVRALGGTSAVLLQGPSGSGKSTLAQWLANQAAESGAADTLYAPHARQPGARHGLGWMLASHYRTAGLKPDEMLARMRGLLDDSPQAEVLARAATELMRPQQTDQDSAASNFQLASPTARWGFTFKLLCHAASHRPLVVFLDDVQFEPDTLAFLNFALEQNSGAPILFVATFTPEEASVEAQAHADVLKERAHLMNVDDLSADVVTTVLERMGLDHRLALQVCDIARGSALFAIQLMQDWTRRGLLRFEGAQLVLENPRVTPETIPDAVEDVWRAALDAVYTTMAGDAGGAAAPQAVALAAALGREVDVHEWQAVAVKLGLDGYARVFSRLAESGLGRLDGDQFTFLNDRLCRLIVAPLADTDAWKKFNRTIAQVLTSRYGQDHPGLALRVARHFVEAHDYTVALMCLEEAHARAFRTGNQDKLAEVLDLQERCLRGRGVVDPSPEWAALHLKRSKLLVWRAEPELRAEGVALLERAEATARARNARGLLAKVLNTRGWLAKLNGQTNDAIEALNEAIDIAPDHVEKAIAHRLLGDVYLEGPHDLDQARLHFTTSATLTRDALDTFSAHQGLFRCALDEGDAAGAGRHLDAAREIARENGLMLGEAFVLENQGDLALSQARWADAVACFEQALDIHNLLGPDTLQAHTTRIRLGRSLARVGRLDAIDRLLDAVNPDLRVDAADLRLLLAIRDRRPVASELVATALRAAPDYLQDTVKKAIAGQ